MNNYKQCARLLLMVMLAWSLPLLTGCALKTVYVQGSSKTVPLTAGEPAPFAGWLLGNEALIDLTECCEACE